MFEIRVDDKEIKALEKALAGFPRAMPKIMSRAINKTAESSRTQISRSLVDRIGVKKGVIQSRVVLKKATYSTWRALVSLSTKRFSLIELGAHQTKKGVTYKKVGTRARVLIRHAFKATMVGGFPLESTAAEIRAAYGGDAKTHTGIFKRRDSSRLPIVELRGPSLAYAYKEMPDLLRKVMQDSAAKLEKNIAYQVELILGRKGK